MKEEKILINNLEVNYKIAGQGQPILILHGWGGSSDSWLKVQEILSQKGYQVICPDLPGFGKSKTPLLAWGIDDYVKWVADFTKTQNLEKFFLCAHSFGGRIAIKFVIKYPEKINGLILCASAGIKPKPSSFQKLIFWGAKIGNSIFGLKHLIRLKDGARNAFYIFLRHKDYVKANGMMKEIIKNVLAEDLLPELSKIETKTLIVWGQNDKMVSQKFAYIFKEKIKNSRLEILSQVGHSPHLEVPEKLSEIMTHFLWHFSS